MRIIAMHIRTRMRHLLRELAEPRTRELLKRKARLAAPLIGTLAIILVLVATCAWLWHVEALRPYLAGLGAGIAAFLGPLPGIVDPETRGKWLIAILLAAVIAVGTWFASDAQEQETKQLDTRLSVLRESFQGTLQAVPSESHDIVFLREAPHMRDLFNSRQLQSVWDLTDVLANVDQENGHVLYFRGEVKRVSNERIAMRGYLWNYLQGADHHKKEAFDGDAKDCYLRVSGYCKERTAWVNHVLANDYYNEAQAVDRGKRGDRLYDALKYERYDFEIRPSGFEPIGSIQSSCELLQGIRNGLIRLEQSQEGAQSALKQYCLH